MKKIFFAFAAIVMSAFATEANAQILSQFDWMPPYKLGATVGLNVPSFSDSHYSASIGFQTGLNLMVDGSEFMKNTFGRVELKYSMKGGYHYGFFNNEALGTRVMEDAYFTSHYLEIPVHAGYAWYINEDYSFMLEAGPYFALGLAGRQRSEGMVVDANGSKRSYSTTEPFFGGSNNCTRFDVGLGLQASLMYLKDYQVHVAYDFGFVNLNPMFQQNRNFSIGVTYFFE